ncbi:hypothetical protein AS156_28280 [Bradyrhizobium macuxiense]|uniref:AcrB/AcrD/AcrF family protein n=1 Tax=Bradyrhizobium macuxiense TaxID=1755647 RepID=A0A109K4M3_9BRAD|nr:hypothetical protein AS156_28280 [Bradyrhizobium macuxiense]
MVQPNIASSHSCGLGDGGADGAGAASRFAIGIVVVMGMLIGTLFTLLVLPTFYILIARDHRAVSAPRLERVAVRDEIAA